MNISLFCNVYINDYRNYKTALRSFKSLPLWIFEELQMNFRGKYSDIFEQHILRLIKRKQYQGKVSTYRFETGISWKHDSKLILNKIRTKYVFTWVEDHICVNATLFAETVDDIICQDIDTFTYSFHNWAYRSEVYAQFKKEIINNLVIITSSDTQRSQVNFEYDHSLVSIQKTSLIKEICTYKVKNFRYRLTPLEAEVQAGQLSNRQLRKGFFIENIFRSVDDDHDLLGSSLVGRMEYPPYPRVTNFFNDTKDTKRSLKRFIVNRFLLISNRILSHRFMKIILAYDDSFFEMSLATLKLHMSLYSIPKFRKTNICRLEIPPDLLSSFDSRTLENRIIKKILEKYKQ